MRTLQTAPGSDLYLTMVAIRRALLSSCDRRNKMGDLERTSKTVNAVVEPAVQIRVDRFYLLTGVRLALMERLFSARSAWLWRRRAARTTSDVIVVSASTMMRIGKRRELG